ncbi:MAG: hypothetical protein U5K29_06060 [Acidimicrobiales bacterium]|nr:hypothetical protein [Acidimicrobiales bacterium]
MSRSPCPSCGTVRGPVGPCPGCGALPELEIEGTGAAGPGEPVRVTAGGRRRRVAVLVVIAVVAMVGIGLVTGGDGDGPQVAEDEPEPSTPTTGSSVPSTPPGTGDGYEAVEGFEDQVLLQVAPDGTVVQFPLDGETGTQVIRTGDPDDGWTEELPRVLMEDVLISRFAGVSLSDGSVWGSSLGPPHDGLPGPFETWTTTDDTVIMPSGRSFTELDPRGEQIAAWGFPFDGVGGSTVGVAGRRLIHESPHGIYSFDLDSRELTRIGHGRVMAVGSSRLAVETCGRSFDCRVEILAASDGAVMATLPSGLELAGDDSTYAFEPVFSPDGSRLALATRGGLAVFDTATGGGRVVGDVGAVRSAGVARPTRRVGTLTVLWNPDSTHAMAVAHHHLGLVDELGVAAVLTFDRDLTSVHRRDDLRRALDGSAAPRGVRVAHVLGDRRYEPLSR